MTMMPCRSPAFCNVPGGRQRCTVPRILSVSNKRAAIHMESHIASSVVVPKPLSRVHRPVLEDCISTSAM